MRSPRDWVGEWERRCSLTTAQSPEAQLRLGLVTMEAVIGEAVAAALTTAAASVAHAHVHTKNARRAVASKSVALVHAERDVDAVLDTLARGEVPR